MSMFELGTIKGHDEITLARTIAELVRQGVTFRSLIEMDGEWTITLTGGY
jgi:hypothetical protein